ncbi:MAG: S-layer homology domain-containing protein, partial [Peptococcaceae bacterium]|nr:S-layer homology domain-containing protein [Peptococcaceae bacterium]
MVSVITQAGISLGETKIWRFYEMKKILFLALVMAMCLTVWPAASLAAGIPFDDVPASAWYYHDVETAYNSGLINGRSATKFKPDDNMTVAEAVKLAACMHQLYHDGAVTLKNGTPNWYDTYMAYAFSNGIIE